MPIDDALLRRLRAAPAERIVAELKSIHARRTHQGGQPAPRTAVVPESEAQSRYERARRHFAGEEQRLRKQALLTDRIIDEMRNRESERDPRGTRETLFVRGALGRPAGGRFRLANRFARALDVRLEASTLRARESGVTIPCPIDVRPSELRLGPGEERVVHIVIDLGAANAPLHAGGILAGEIVARADGVCVHRLWLEIEPYALEPDEEAP